MKKANKILSVILALIMVLSIFSITASADTPISGTSGENVTWELDKYTETVCTEHTQTVIPEFAPTATTIGLTAGVKCSACGATAPLKQL